MQYTIEREGMRGRPRKIRLDDIKDGTQLSVDDELLGSNQGKAQRRKVAAEASVYAASVKGLMMNDDDTFRVRCSTLCDGFPLIILLQW